MKGRVLCAKKSLTVSWNPFKQSWWQAFSESLKEECNNLKSCLLAITLSLRYGAGKARPETQSAWKCLCTAEGGVKAASLANCYSSVVVVMIFRFTARPSSD